ncbi:MAG: DUF433 domain-containing protein [Phycisphaerae bacterium]|nr:DUF433 domain-containing protein [Phycisphaerae bacterium]
MDNRIEINPRIHHGRPVIRGTRVPVERVLGELAEGAEVKDICEQYDLSPEDVGAALAYAQQIIATEEFVATTGK